MPWTRFMDMHSGGGCKEKPYEYIYIGAPEKEAKIVFYNRFHHSPDRVSCTCCGADYSVDESEDLIQASAYDRECDFDEKEGKYVERSRTKFKYKEFIPFDEWLKDPKNTLLIWPNEIKPEEKIGEIPLEGYVWH